MTLAYYFDRHMVKAIADGLRRRGIDVLLTEEDGTDTWGDELLLGRAMELNRVFVSIDRDLRRITADWSRQGRDYAGVVAVKSQYIPVGKVIDDLQLIAEVYTPEEMMNRTEYTPL